jgi:hypothetical protein
VPWLFRKAWHRGTAGIGKAAQAVMNIEAGGIRAGKAIVGNNHPAAVIDAATRFAR